MLKKTSLPNSNCYSDPVASAAIHLNCTYRLFVQLLNGENLDDKYATGVTKIKKIRDRENISVGTGIKGLWGQLGMLLKNFGEVSIDNKHKVYFSREDNRHVYVHKFRNF